MSTTMISPVTAFIDWNSQIRAAALPKGLPELERMERVFRYVGRIVGRALNDCSPTERFDVTLRLYHGWHHGFKVTQRRKAVRQVVAGLDFPSISTQPNVVIRRDIQYGDNLISATGARLHTHLSCHLPNTYRWSLKSPDLMEEKMVDTAIAGDLVDVAHRDLMRWVLIFGDDDDLVPPLFIAEGIRAEHRGAPVLIVRTRPQTPFLKLSEIEFRP